MIYWFTGQPGSGKTVLADLLKKEVLPHAFRIDGDEMRELFANKDYSENIKNIVYLQVHLKLLLDIWKIKD